MRAINIISIVLSVAIIPISLYYIEETSRARWASWDWGGYSNYYGPSAKEYSMEASLIVLLFILYFLFVNIANLSKVKTVTAKVMGIIGLSIVGLGFLFNLLVISSDGAASFDEVGVAWVILGLIMIAFSIVFLVQSVKQLNAKKKPQNLDTIDDIV
ncbi:MAG: hypothetical protein WDZ35_07175 [Crocinitomicaceae bacterium]